MTDPKTALQNLAARGITTLEQLAASKARMRGPQRIDSEKALEEILARSAAPPDPSYKSKIGPPASSVAIVLDGKRVEYDAIARLKGQPLDYVATRLKGGEQALAIFSDRSIMRNLSLRHFKGSLRTIDQEVENALMAGGLQPSSTFAPRGDFEARIFADHYYEGDSAGIWPTTGQHDLREFDDGLGWFEGNWDDKISSIGIRGSCQLRCWADPDWQGDFLLITHDMPELDSIGWNDRISSLWCDYRFSG
jgi:hypothetical protein